MRETRGDLWAFHEQGAWVAIPTNGVVKFNGENVMGRGVALQARSRHPELPARLGHLIRSQGNLLHVFSEWRLVSFPTKHQWKDPSDLLLIVHSARQLMYQLTIRGIDEIYLPRPGCGLGGLDWADVCSAIAPILDERVVIVSLEI